MWDGDTSIETVARAMGAKARGPGYAVTVYDHAGGASTHHPALGPRVALRDALIGGASLVIWDDDGLHGPLAFATAGPGDEYIVPLKLRVRMQATGNQTEGSLVDLRIGSIGMTTRSEREESVRHDNPATQTIHRAVSGWLAEHWGDMPENIMMEPLRLVDTRTRVTCNAKGEFNRGPDRIRYEPNRRDLEFRLTIPAILAEDLLAVYSARGSRWNGIFLEGATRAQTGMDAATTANTVKALTHLCDQYQGREAIGVLTEWSKFGLPEHTATTGVAMADMATAVTGRKLGEGTWVPTQGQRAAVPRAERPEPGEVPGVSGCAAAVHVGHRAEQKQRKHMVKALAGKAAESVAAKRIILGAAWRAIGRANEPDDMGVWSDQWHQYHVDTSDADSVQAKGLLNTVLMTIVPYAPGLMTGRDKIGKLAAWVNSVEPMTLAMGLSNTATINEVSNTRRSASYGGGRRGRVSPRPS
jgi:hypothetical protein